MGFSRRGILAALAVALHAPLRRHNSAQAASNKTPAATAVPTRAGAPAVLHIPAIGVSAPVEPVWLVPADERRETDQLLSGATRDYQIGVPSSPDTVGWYALGAVPGAPGSTLVVGHLDTPTRPAVFAGLPALRPGATISLDTVEGQLRHFTVEATWRHPAHLPAPAALFALSGEPRLYLVTCTGQFVRDAGGYLERLIVAAVPVMPRIERAASLPAEAEAETEIEQEGILDILRDEVE